MAALTWPTQYMVTMPIVVIWAMVIQPDSVIAWAGFMAWFSQ